MLRPLYAPATSSKGRLTYDLVPGPSGLVYTLILNAGSRTSSFLPSASPPPPAPSVPDNSLLSALGTCFTGAGTESKATPESSGDSSGGQKVFINTSLLCSTATLPHTPADEIVAQREACALELLPDGSGQASSEPKCWLGRSWQRQPCGHSLSWPSFATVQVSCPTRPLLSPALWTPL